MNPKYLDLSEVLNSYRSKTYKPKNLARRAIDWIVPVLDHYDPIEEAQHMYHNENSIRRKGLTLEDTITHVTNSYNKNAELYATSQIADTGDRVLGAIATFTDLSGFGHVLDILLEVGIKAPFYKKLGMEHLGRGVRSGAVEMGTSAIPVVGHWYDLMWNLYMRGTRKTIREDALKSINAESHPQTVDVKAIPR
jgi:hypothetical protein